MKESRVRSGILTQARLNNRKAERQVYKQVNYEIREWIAASVSTHIWFQSSHQIESIRRQGKDGIRWNLYRNENTTK